MELRLDDGDLSEGELFPIPSGSIDAEQAYLILAPVEGPMTGTVVASDADDDVVQRKPVESSG